MSAILLLVVIPSVIALLFSLFVAYYAIPDAMHRNNSGSRNDARENVHTLVVPNPG